MKAYIICYRIIHNNQQEWASIRAENPHKAIQKVQPTIQQQIVVEYVFALSADLTIDM